MPNENQSNRPSPESAKHPLPETNVAPSAVQQQEMRGQANGGPNDEQNKTIQLERDIRSGERWIIGITAVGVILNFIVAMIYLGQLKEMRKATQAAVKSADAATKAADIADKTLNEIRTGGTDTHELAVQAKNQADRMKEQLPEIRKSADAAKTAAAAAKISADISQRQVRAYVNLRLSDQYVLKFDEKTKYVYGSIPMENGGQSPAENVVTQHYIQISTLLPSIADNCTRATRVRESDITNPSKSTMGPKGLIGLPVNIPDGDVLWKGIQAQEATLCVFGSVFYDDIFAVHHETEFCIYFVANSWMDCANHNAMYDFPTSKNTH